ncbi:DUF4105 domain-containing protein [Nibrella viscosa]|uniref:DUF4105 domain-containing protein n=1 Tax=Nibrella viscosa TaxID=1084524 RepID=A0ABP8L0E1_9BACT
MSVAQPLSPSARVSLITVSPGAELYSSFGHTAIRIYDPANGLDKVYNYGTFDFRTENFYLKFLQGTLPYQLSVADMSSMVYGSQYENRSVKEQVLNLSPTQRQRLSDLLETNYLPENRSYRYKFYYDNCSSRPRDIILKAAADSIKLSKSFNLGTKSFREWMNDYLGNQPWARFGMNVGLGRPADETASDYQEMFLPENLYQQFAHATILQPDGQPAPLVTVDQTVFQAIRAEPLPIPFYATPEFVFGLLLLLVCILTGRQLMRQQPGYWIDHLLFGFAGVCGWILLLLWVATDHGVTAWNPSLVWLPPFHMPLIFWATQPGHPRRTINYFRLTFALALISLILYGANVPGQADSLFILTLLVRCAYHMFIKHKAPQAVLTSAA